MRIFRQGDIVFKEIERFPEGEITKEDDKIEISGETGQLHVLPKVKVIEINWNKLLVETPKEGGVMTHPEHPPLELPPLTKFEVRRVRSVTPYID